MIDARARTELAPSGTIRAAINTANPATVTVAADNGLSGPCIDLALALGNAADLPVEFIRYTSAGQVVAAEQAGDAWDIAFLAVDPARAARLRFSAPYLTIEAGYAVPAASTIATASGVDRAGIRIASVIGAAYDLHLQRQLKVAERCPYPDPAASFAAFDSGECTAVAGVRLALLRRFEGHADIRVLPDSFLTIRQAIVVPVARRVAAEAIDVFVAKTVSGQAAAR